MRSRTGLWCTCLLLLLPAVVAAQDKPKLTDYFPPPESKGGWRTLLPEQGAPDVKQKAKILETTGVDWDKLSSAWEYNRAAEGASIG